MIGRVLAAALAGLLVAGAAQAQTLSGAALANALRQGGYVLVMRHASSPTAIPSKENAAPGNFAPERQLDAKGQEQARDIGAAFKTLKLPIGAVLSSPTYRAIETVRYAQFGIPLPVPELGDAGQGMAANVEEARRAWLRKKVQEAPPANQNIILVTHAPNITSVFGKDSDGIADAETMVFHPDGKGGTQLVARVKAEDWAKLK